MIYGDFPLDAASFMIVNASPFALLQAWTETFVKRRAPREAPKSEVTADVDNPAVGSKVAAWTSSLGQPAIDARSIRIPIHIFEGTTG
jgi:hypothetical protein